MATATSKSKNNNVRCAYSTSCVPDLCKTLNTALELKFTYLVCPLFHPRFKREFIATNLKHQSLPFTRSDLLLNADCWQNYVVGRASKFYNCDSEDEIVRRNAESGLCEELKFTGHLNLSAFIIPIRSSRIENFIRIINGFLLNKLILYNILISIPICISRQDIIENEDIEEIEKEDTWDWWRKIRTICEESSKLGLILELTANLPSQQEINRWFSEPLKALVIPTSIFLTNKLGFPVLSKAHQQTVLRFFKLDIDIIVEGACRTDKGMNKYYEYINHLFKNQDPGDATSKFTKGYEDCLQNPLQPLMDNLESQIYEIFEKDPCKYVQYRKAVAQALLDRVDESEKQTKEVIITVVGAGRGPLVKASLEAAFETERKVKIYAVEKNPNEINTLLCLKNDEWGDKVDVVASDMRDWNSPIKADIMVSELLGSFGCNELSPECLYGAQKFLKDDGISIPCRYRSFIAPVQSFKIYCEMKKCKEYEFSHEAPYVVLLHNHYRIDEPKDIFEFIHPNRDPESNSTEKYAKCDFLATQDSTMHGIVGYFDCDLYKDINISIVPQTHSPGLFSWFPIFFPLKTPVQIKAKDKITINFWRKTAPRQVWYEWCVSSPISTHIHNPNGRTYWIGL